MERRNILIFFTGLPTAVPDLIDGNIGGDPYDLNTSIYSTAVIEQWNNLMQATASMWSGLDEIGGDGSGSPLLMYTRYVQFVNPGSMEVVPLKLSKIPKQARKYLKEVEEPVPDTKDSKDIKDRRASKKEVRKFMAYAPPNNSPYSEYEVGMSCLVPITATAKTYLKDFILPVIEVNTGDNLPGLTQIQSASLEGYSYAQQYNNILASRAFSLIASVKNCVKGIAGTPSPLAQFIAELSAMNQGGFFGDLFSAVGAGANALGLSGIGNLASTAGSVANAFGA